MKVVVVLVLAVFTGCNANLLFADAPKSRLSELSDSFWHYVAKSKQTVDETYKQFRQSEFGQELSTSLEDGARLATMYGEKAWDQVPKGIQHGLGGISMGFYGLGLKIEQGMETLADKVSPVAEKVESELTQRGQQVVDFATPYVEKLLDRVDPVVQTVQDRLDTIRQSF